MTASTAESPVSAVLPAEVWIPREQAHRDRADEFTAPHRRRAQRGETHPVWDFLFRYYSLRPGQLRVWHPGYGTALSGAQARRYLRRSGYLCSAAGVTVEIGRAHV